MSATSYTEGLLADYLFTAVTAPTRPPGIWIGLFTAPPSDSGGGTEVSAGGYARKSTVRGTDWNRSGSSPTRVSNAQPQEFAAATASWGTITHFGVFDAATGGNLLAWSVLTNAQTISVGGVMRAGIGAITFDFS